MTTSTGKPTKGMRILGIRLYRCDFSFSPEEEVDRRVNLLPEPERVLEIQTKVSTVESTADPEKPNIGSVAIEVVVSGEVKDIVCWSILATYQGIFEIAPDSDIKMDDALKVHAPAHLYAFAREFIADIARRSELSPRGIYLPPWNFQSNRRP